MSVKQKIAIVAGEISNLRNLMIFTQLCDKFEVSVFVLDHQHLQKMSTFFPFKLRIYENSADMPGYLRGLEDDLLDFDAIIGIETSRLATFQAVRAARRFGIPLGVVVHEFQPYFYEKYPNIRAIQYDICNKAEMFWTTSEAAFHSLRLDRVPEVSIKRVDARIDTNKFKICDQKRQKFRNYVGIKTDEIVLLFLGELTSNSRPDLALEMLAIAYKMTGMAVPSLRLIFVGQGPMSADLKYKVFDGGMQQAVVFIHQDPEPFLADLYAASDILVAPRIQRSEIHEDFPLGVLEGMASGVIPLVGAGTVASELAGGSGLIYSADQAEQLASMIQLPILNRDLLTELKTKARLRSVEKYSLDIKSESFISEVEKLIYSRPTERILRRFDKKMLAEIQSFLDRGEPRSALVKIEELMLIGTQIPEEKSTIFRLKGDAHYAASELEEATAAYAEALKCDQNNFLAMSGLGFVSWQSHSNDEALAFFKKSLAIDAQNAKTMFGIGLVYRRLSLLEEAMFWLEKSLTSANSPAPAYIVFSQCCLQSPDSEESVKRLERVIEAAGEQKALLLALGQLYVQIGSVEKGQKCIDRAGSI